jgi:hypothetical protein
MPSSVEITSLDIAPETIAVAGAARAMARDRKGESGEDKHSAAFQI